MREIILNNEADTNELGKRIAYEIVKLDKPTIELHLEGELGTGKTGSFINMVPMIPSKSYF